MNTTMELVKTIQNCKKGDLPKNFCSRFPRLSEIIKDSLSNDPQKRPLLSKIEQTLLEMEIMESQFNCEVIGKYIVTYEQEPKQVAKCLLNKTKKHHIINNLKIKLQEKDQLSQIQKKVQKKKEKSSKSIYNNKYDNYQSNHYNIQQR